MNVSVMMSCQVLTAGSIPVKLLGTSTLFFLRLMSTNVPLLGLLISRMQGDFQQSVMRGHNGSGATLSSFALNPCTTYRYSVIIRKQNRLLCYLPELIYLQK